MLYSAVICIASCICVCKSEIPSDQSENGFKSYLDSIKTSNIEFGELITKTTLADADFLLENFLPGGQHQQERLEDNVQHLPCSWMGNTICTNTYDPICVTDLMCIFTVKNSCLLDKINCGCALVVTVYAGPGLSLREKLARLLMDPEYDDMNNEISQGDSMWQQEAQKGMLLKNKPRASRFSKERVHSMPIFDITKTAESEQTFDDVGESDENIRTTTTTTEAPSKTQNIVMVGMAPLKAIMSRILELWRG